MIIRAGEEMESGSFQSSAGADDFVTGFFLDYLNADGTAFILLFPDEHPLILPMGHPKFNRLSSSGPPFLKGLRKSGLRLRSLPAVLT